MFRIPDHARPQPRPPTTQPIGQPMTGQAVLPETPRPQNQSGLTRGVVPVHSRPISDPGGMAPPFNAGSTQVQVTPPDFDQFRDFGDIILQEYQRTTAPEIERRRARMNQDLINRGITPGSEAYEAEMTRFMQMENDAFNTAQRGAVTQGLAAQNQAFNQGLGQAQINAAMNQARLSNDASRYGSLMGAQASMYGADQNREGALERLLAGLNQQESEFSRNLGQRESEFGRQFGLAEGQADFGNLMSLLGFGSAVTNQNNNALWNDRQFAGNLLGGFMPNAPFVPINAGGAFNTNLNAQNANAQMRQQQNDAFWGSVGQLGATLPFFFSDRSIKTNIQPVDEDEVLDSLRRIPVSRWQYIGDDVEHIGPMAQDFGEHINGEPESKQISVIDAIGALTASVQALADRMDVVEAAHAT